MKTDQIGFFSFRAGNTWIWFALWLGDRGCHWQWIQNWCFILVLCLQWILNLWVLTNMSSQWFQFSSSFCGIPSFYLLGKSFFTAHNFGSFWMFNCLNQASRCFNVGLFQSLPPPPPKPNKWRGNPPWIKILVSYLKHVVENPSNFAMWSFPLEGV